MLLAFVIFYLLSTIFIGVWASRRVHSSGDFMLAGKSLPMLLSISALFATWFGSETVFGASSEFLRGGLFAVIEDPFGASLCLLLFGRLFARKLYSMNLLTLGDYFRNRYGKRSELLSSLFMVPSYFGYTAGQLVAMGLILKIITGMPLWEGVILSAVIVSVYTCIGGMWAISVTDFFQSIVIIVGLVVLSFVLVQKAGGVVAVFENAPAGSFNFLPQPKAIDIISYMAAWSVLGLGSLPSQDVFQRVMSSGSATIAVRSCYYAAGLYLTIAMLPLFISLCIKHLYPGQVMDESQLTLPFMVLEHTPMVVQVLFFGSLLSAIMSTTSSSLLAPASIFSENIVKPILKDKLSDKGLLFITRTSILLFSIIASIMACINSNIYELVGSSSILSLVSLFVPLIMGLYWRKANSFGAILSMISGMICWIVFELHPVAVPGFVPALIISFFGMIIGSYFYNKKSKL